MFDKKLLMSHIQNESSHNKMIKSGTKTEFSDKDCGCDKNSMDESKKVPSPKGFHFMKKGKNEYKLMKDPKDGYKDHKGSSKEATFDIQTVHRESTEIKEQMKTNKLAIIMKSLTGKGTESGEKTPGRGSEPTDHHEVGGEKREKRGTLTRNVEAGVLKRAVATARLVDPDVRRSDVRDDMIKSAANRMRAVGDI